LESNAKEIELVKQQKEAAELQEQQALEMQEGEESGGGDLEARVRGYLYSKGDGVGY